MPVIEVCSTDDISNQLLDEFISSLNEEEKIAEIGSRISLCSTEPPSWIQIVIDSEWWIKVFGVYAAIYIGEIVKEAGKDTWKHRAKALGATIITGNKILNFIKKAVKLKSRLHHRTFCIIALRIDSSYSVNSPGILLNLTNPDLAALELALFTHHIPALLKLIEEKNLRNLAATGVYLNLQEEGNLFVSWLQWESGNLIQKNALPPLNP